MKHQAEHGPSRRPALWILLTLVVVAIAGVFAGNRYLRASGNKQQMTIPTFAVAKGPLTISVTEAGTIRSRQQEVLKSELEGMNTVLHLIPEGTRVKQGELLVELDASKLQDQKVTQQITVQNADAAFISAQETLAVTESQAASDISAAALAFQFAKDDLEKYINGDYPKQVDDAKAKIQLAKEELTRAIDKYEWSKKLFEEMYLSSSEFQADELAKKQKELSLKLAEGDLTLLEKWTNTRQIATLKSNVEQTEQALERTKRKASADIAQAKANLTAKQLEFEHQKNLLEKTERMIGKSKIYAPMDGLVVYPTTGGGGGDRFRGNQEPLAEGSNVRERQELIYLPTASSVMVEVKIHESSLDKVRLGLPARITIDALPGRVFTGRIGRIAQMPDPNSMWQNADMKVYNTDVHLDGDGSELRTGMSARTEIVVDYYPEALYVPVQAVVRVDGKPSVWVKTPEGFKARQVEIGLDNNRMVRIISGVEAGEEVMLSPPLSEASVATVDLGMPAGGIPAPTTRPTGPAMSPQGPMRGEGMQGGEGRMRGEGGAGGEGRMRGDGSGSGAGGPGAAAGGQARSGRGGGNFQNMTPEQRQEMMRQRMETMTPEEREAFQQRMQQGGRGGRGGRGGDGTGAPGGGAGGGAGGPPANP